MFKFFAHLYRVTVDYLKRYPAASAAVLNIAVGVAAHFGFHVTGDQLVYLFAAVTAVLGAIVHVGVVPIVKIAKRDVEDEIQAKSPGVVAAVKAEAEKVGREIVADVKAVKD